ncbi:MAG TPA: asparagine synthase (glutamine-hydrolyzing) [Gaiellaceae bacterium]|nr:asparagine synthase (glutamine-hydrolyzing) [Gaiellaceae bacterium]
MCGIAGLYSPSGRPNPELVDTMRAALVHRGPDEGSTDAFGRCVLGHQRLRVLDLATGQQPVANETGDVSAVFNGEIYNFTRLREELRGHELRGTGDTPVLPHLYEEDGPTFVRRLHGMYTFALWDETRSRLVLARDRLGKKPLVWTRLPDGTLAFASELKALLTLPGVEREVDLAAIDEYLALQYVPADRTGFLGVRRLLPGHLLVAEGDALTIERYWQPRPHPSFLPEGEWLERVRATVTEAVRDRLRSDVPLGALLSGGIDSSIVVALMAQASAQPVRTFTVGFDDPRYDERSYARAVSRRYSTVHEELAIDADVAATLPRLARAYDEPLGDEAAFPTFLICEQARRHVTVALTGDGGDESFAGYERYVAHGIAGRVPSPIARAGAGALRLVPDARRSPRSTAFRTARLLDAAAVPSPDRYTRLMEVFPKELRSRIWSDGVAHEVRLEPSGAGITGLQLLDLETYLPGDLLPKADIGSMAHSLELRSPLLDHRVVELGLALPDSLKTHGRTGKVALRHAFARELPHEVSGRGKTGFGVPLGRWFRTDLRELSYDVLTTERGWFEPAEVRRLLDDHVAGRTDHGHRLWCLLMLELWAREHVDAPALVPA